MENNALTDHAYDGIQEYDNPLPGWWTYTFVATIVFSIGYVMWYHTGAPGRDLVTLYEVADADNTRLQFGAIGDLTGDQDTLMKFAHREDWLKVGASVFKANCISCHGRDGEGNVGPNLTDEAFKYIRKPEDVYKVVSEGAGKGAMPAWGNRLHPNEVVLVSSYVISLRGQNLPGKAADGNPIPAWPAPPPEEPEAEQ
ncbi:MAG: c-type cytochrome [Pirellulaceae bacterium]|nr:c-type cytochrome [Pirellulaceae bacterium]